jgi:hypothetical protein
MQTGTLFGLLVRGLDLREIERRENEELGAHRREGLNCDAATTQLGRRRKSRHD